MSWPELSVTPPLNVFGAVSTTEPLPALLTMMLPAPEITAPSVVELLDVEPTLIVNRFPEAIVPLTETGPALVLLIAPLAAAALKLESDPLAMLTLPVDVPLKVIVAIENCPGMSSVAVYVCEPLDGKNSAVDAPEPGRLVQFAGLLQVLLPDDSHVCDRATGAADAMADAKIAERTMSFFAGRM
jgi:hypothetical protein